MKDRQLPIWEQLLKSADTAEKSVLSQHRCSHNKGEHRRNLKWTPSSGQR